MTDEERRYSSLAPYSTDANKEVDQVKAPTLILATSKATVAPPRMGTSFYEALSPDLTKKYEALEEVGHHDFEIDGAHHELIITPVFIWLDQHGKVSCHQRAFSRFFGGHQRSRMSPMLLVAGGPGA